MMRLIALGHGNFPRPLVASALDGGHCFGNQIPGRLGPGHFLQQIQNRFDVFQSLAHSRRGSADGAAMAISI